jgi:hypothetical protein
VLSLDAPNRLEVSLDGNKPGQYSKLLFFPIQILSPTFIVIVNKFSQDVWTTDYDNYAVIYSCSSIIPLVAKLELMWILARVPVLDSQIVAGLKNQLSSAGIAVKSFLTTDHADCKYETN